MLKNYIKEGQRLPLFGIGPYMIFGMGAVNLMGIILFGYPVMLDGLFILPAW